MLDKCDVTDIAVIKYDHEVPTWRMPSPMNSNPDNSAAGRSPKYETWQTLKVKKMMMMKRHDADLFALWKFWISPLGYCARRRPGGRRQKVCNLYQWCQWCSGTLKIIKQILQKLNP